MTQVSKRKILKIQLIAINKIQLIKVIKNKEQKIDQLKVTNNVHIKTKAIKIIQNNNLLQSRSALRKMKKLNISVKNNKMLPQSQKLPMKVIIKHRR